MTMQLLVKILLTLSFNSLVIANTHFTQPNDYKLEQLQVLFRHGDRAPTEYDIYEGDPYDEIYKSIGYGQLTKIGKQREYNIGQFLRRRYDSFLGEYQYDVYAYSSNLDRTKMSLQLVLAGLYPPTASSSWNNFINWQPIPTHYETLGILTAMNFCFDKYDKLYRNVGNRPEMLEIFKRHDELFQKIKNNTGVTTSQLFTALNIYSNLRSALSLGLPLPPWCSANDFHELETIAALGFKAMTYTEQLRRMVAGPIVEQFLKNFNENDKSKKIYLYSGHEFNIASFINAHNITDAPSLQDYGNALILEKLKGPDNRYYIRLYMWIGVSETLIFLKLNNCARTCSLTDYEKIVQTILPNEKSNSCSSRSVLCGRMQSDAEIDLDLRLSRLFAGSDLTSFKYMKTLLPYAIERS